MTKDLLVYERELLNNSIEFIKSMTIKNPFMAKKYETTEIAKNADYYQYVIENEVNIEFLDFEYTVDDLKEMGIINRDLLVFLSENNNMIPEEYRYQMLEHKINQVKDGYIEMNDYYRMLNGLPSIETESNEFFYVELKDDNGNIYTKPVHELTNSEFYQIENNKTYKKLLEENPNEKYLFYVHPNNKISFYAARKTKDFHIMGYNKTFLNELYTKQIIDFYYQILVYTLSVVYTDSFKHNDYYDSFIIVYMLTATLQKFLSNFPTNIMRRDIFDIDSVRNMFLSYGLTFYEDIPLKFQKKIVKNMNHLLSYKGTDTVFVDIADIFGLKDTELYKYYMVKDFKRDEAGNPISTDLTDLDNVELKFAQVSTRTNDISSFLKTDYLYQTYEEVVGGDPYWGENDGGNIDSELVDEIKDLEFNYIATKYLSVNTIFNMSESAFETCYFFNLLNTMQYKKLLDELYFYNTDIKNNGQPLRLFDVVTALYILLFRRFGYKDFIPVKPTSIASIYGFNFDTDLNALKEYMHTHSEVDIEGKKIYYWLNEDIENLIKTLDLPNNPSKADILDEYFENKKFNDSLKDFMLHTDDYRSYKAVEAIYNYNMYSDCIKNLYSDESDTFTFDTYTDWLEKHDNLLLKWVDENSLDDEQPHGIDKELTVKAIDSILDSLEMYFNSTGFTNLFNNTNITLDLIREYFIRMVSIFKAYTVEIKKVNIYYLFNDKFLNSLRIFSMIKKIVNMEKGDSIEKEMAEEIEMNIKMYLKNEDLKGLEEYVNTIINIFKRDRINMNYFRLYKSVFAVKGDSIEYEMDDTFKAIKEEILKDDLFIKDIDDIIDYFAYITRQDKIIFKEEILKKYDLLKTDSLEYEMTDDSSKEKEKEYKESLVNCIKDILKYMAYIERQDEFNVTDSFIKEFIFNKGDSFESNITDELNKEKEKFFKDDSITNSFQDSLNMNSNSKLDKIDSFKTKDTNTESKEIIQVDSFSSISDGFNRSKEKSYLDNISLEAKIISSIVKRCYEKFKIKDIYIKNNNPIYADAANILDIDNIIIENRTFEDINKIINGREDLIITYSYK